LNKQYFLKNIFKFFFVGSYIISSYLIQAQIQIQVLPAPAYIHELTTDDD